MDNKFITEYLQDNIKYEISTKINQGMFLIIQVNELSGSRLRIFRECFVIDQITTEYEIFRSLDSLSKFKEEVLDKEIKDKTIKLRKEGEKMILFFKIQETTLQFELSFDEEVSMEKLSECIKDQEEEITKLKEEKQILMEEIKKLMEESEQYKEEKKEIAEALAENILPKDSEIIKRTDEISLINSTVKKKMGRNIKELRKLFDSKTDGDSMAVLHSKIDNISNTLVVVESAGNRRYGGFASAIWDQTGFKDDKKAFLFSFDEMKTYNYKKFGNAIGGWNNGIQFGNGLIRIGEDFTHQRSSETTTEAWQKSYDCPDFKLGDDAKSCFTLNQVEVFELLF